MFIKSPKPLLLVSVVISNRHQGIPDGLPIDQCRLGHAIGIVVFDTISVAWNERGGQLVDGGASSVWR